MPTNWLVRLQKYWTLFLLFVIPLTLHYLTEHPFAISTLNLLSVGLVFLCALNVLLRNLTLAQLEDRSFFWVVSGLLLAMLWALFFTHPLRNGVGLWTSRLVQPLLVGWSVYQLLANRVLRLREIVLALFASLVPLIGLGAMQLLHLLPYDSPGRTTALYQFPNTFARYIFMLLLVSIPWIVLRLRGKQRLVAVVVWGVGALLLLTTKSYGGTVACFAGLVTVLLLLPADRARLRAGGLAILAVLALLVVTNAHYLPKWQTSITDSRVTRLEFWQVARGVIHEHFWTGIGIKGWETQYAVNVRKFAPYPPHNWASPQPHDVFLDSFVKAGLPGFLAITAFLLWPVLAGVQVARRHRSGAWFAIAITACGVALICFGIIDDPLWSDDMVPLLFILYFALAWLRCARDEQLLDLAD